MPLPTGRKSSIGATALSLTPRVVRNRNGVTIKAGAGNSTNLVYVGSSGISAAGADNSSGFELAVGQEVNLPPSKFQWLSDVYVIGSTTGLTVYWWCDGDEAAELDFGYGYNSQYWWTLF